MKITEEHSKKIESLISKKTFTLQDIVSLLDNLYTENQIRYHINKYYRESKGNLVKEYSKGGTKLEYLLKEIFPYDKIRKEFPLGERLRVDYVIVAPYNLAFEFDGVQHDEYSSFFHGSKGAFEESKQRDERKEFLLSNRGMNLIRLSTLEMDRTSLQSLIDLVGYGSGQILDESLLTYQERLDHKLELDKERIKALTKERNQLRTKKAKQEETDKDKAYKESLKLKQKEYRKQQYEKQKQWLKENKKKKK